MRTIWGTSSSHRSFATAATLGVLTLAGCTAPIVVDPAPHADDPACASVMLAVPDTVGGLPRRGTTGQATDAWGEGFEIVMRCGIELPAPTTDSCVTIELPGGTTVDWIVADQGEWWVAATYARDPAVEVVVPKVRADQAIGDVLAELTPAAALASVDLGHACVGGP